ncbi:MAG: hypothetical protein ABIA47_02350 [bacterium]
MAVLEITIERRKNAVGIDVFQIKEQVSHALRGANYLGGRVHHGLRHTVDRLLVQVRVLSGQRRNRVLVEQAETVRDEWFLVSHEQAGGLRSELIDAINKGLRHSQPRGSFEFSEAGSSVLARSASGTSNVRAPHTRADSLGPA